MAGAGYKLFNTGDVLTAAQVNTYLQEQAVMRFANSTARTSALSGVLAEGMVSYLDDTNAVEVYNGSAWVSIGSSGDITGVTAGTGISGGGTSGDVTITNSMATAIDAKGDLIVGTGADTFARLAVGGTNGHVLTVDSAEATGMKWAAAAGGASFVGVSVYDSNMFQTIANNTYTALVWNSEYYDTDTFHSTSTNTSRFTVPSGKGGYYLVTAATSWIANATGARRILIRKNGTDFRRNGDVPGNSTVVVGTQMTIIIPLTVGDYIEVFVRQTSGGDLDCATGDGTEIFEMYYLGA
jgi:hypothetical protein